MGIRRFLKGSHRLRRLLRVKTKGRAFAVLVIVVSIVLGYVFFLASWLSGFFIAKWLSGRDTGKRGIVPSIKLPLGRYRLHLHHWFISSVLMACTLIVGGLAIPGQLFYGIAAGITFQGIYSYRDWHTIIVRQVKRTDASMQSITSGPGPGPARHTDVFAGNAPSLVEGDNADHPA
ncbi:MAG: hypothetical protein HY671_09475 [Chloroflexi bacterium]|nr:hypothetical protein [Chloroflexota bacterium]